MKSTETSPPPHDLKKAQPEEFDIVILGGGTGATLAAWTFAGEGKRVAIIDRKYIGGSCPNIACLPSKNIIHSAKVASYVRHSDEFGIARDGFKIDMSGVRDRKRKMVSGLNEMYLENYKKTGAELIMGSGRFIAPRTVEVTLPDGSRRVLRGANVIISTGTHASSATDPGLAEAQPITHIEALELDVVPEHLLVIGGGYVGIELAQAMRRFGSEVTILEHGERLLPREDDDVVEGLSSLLNDEGIEIRSECADQASSGHVGAVGGSCHRAGWGGENARRHSSAGCGGPHAQYRGNWAGAGGRRSERARIPQGQRAAANDGRKCLGDRRGCRQPAVHPHQR